MHSEVQRLSAEKERWGGRKFEEKAG